MCNIGAFPHFVCITARQGPTLHKSLDMSARPLTIFSRFVTQTGLAVTPLVSFLPTFAVLPAKQGYMLQNVFKNCRFLLLDPNNRCFPRMILLLTTTALCMLIFAKQVKQIIIKNPGVCCTSQLMKQDRCYSNSTHYF